MHGTSAITAITAQNTVEVAAVEAVSPEMIVAQVRAVVSDLGVDAVKIGMLGSAASAEAVGRALDLLAPGTPVVVDPVMVAESGGRLLEHDAETGLRELILPRATVATPNVPEARVLAGAGDDVGPQELVLAVQALGPRYVVLTGGHRDEATDLFTDGREVIAIPGERHAGRRGPRLRLHARCDARRAARTRAHATRGRPHRPSRRGRRGARRSAGTGLRVRAGRRARAGRARAPAWSGRPLKRSHRRPSEHPLPAILRWS